MGIDEVRRRFADELARELGLSEAVRDAFAAVPREQFLDRGPWLVFQPEGYFSTSDGDPAQVYSDQSLAIDVSRFINNSSPYLGARMVEALDLAEGATVVQVGCGTGYYTAILAELVGRRGRVVALELEPVLAERARRNLRKRRQVTVSHADGTELPDLQADAVMVSAGATHPQADWLDVLAPGGRLVFPLTGTRIPGGVTARLIRDHAGQVLRVERQGEGYAARFIERVAIPALFGGRDPDLQKRIHEAFSGGGARLVRSLRREPHEHDASCWLVGAGFCLSTREV